MQIKASELKAGDLINITVNMGTARADVLVTGSESDRHETTVFYDTDNAIIFDKDELVDVKNASAGAIVFEMGGIEYRAEIFDSEPQTPFVAFETDDGVYFLGAPTRA